MKKRSGFNIFIFFLCVSFLLMANVFPGEAREDKGKKPQYTLTVNVSPPGAGYVTKTPDKANYAPGEKVQLQATASPGYTFTNWSGGASGSSNPVTITMDGNKTVTANFKQTIRYTLVVNVSPPGAGYLMKSPDKANYAPGEKVQLQATASPGYTFTNWSGGASGSSNPVTITMDGNKTVTANFKQTIRYTLVVNVSPPGAGYVMKSPDKANYAPGEKVQLQATASPGYTFTNWSGGASGSSNPVTITMDGNKTVTANFKQTIRYTLVVNVSPPGAGYVMKSPDKANYAPGEKVQLQATASPGYTFTNWSGGASGSSNPVTITMDGNKTVTANFKQTIRYTLVVNVSPPGAGYVTKTPDKANYAPGDRVTLTARPTVCYCFDWWSGDVSGSSNPVTITMDGNKRVEAHFKPKKKCKKYPNECKD